MSHTQASLFVEARSRGITQAGPKVCIYLTLFSNFCDLLALASASWALGIQALATTPFVFIALSSAPSLFLLEVK